MADAKDNCREHSGDTDRRVLLARAEALSRPTGRRGRDSRAGKPYLEFLLGEAAHAVDALLVIEAFLPGEVVPVPGVPAHVLGVCPWRGEILPVVDLGLVCGARAQDLPERYPVVVVGRGKAACGLAVSAVTGSARLDPGGLARIENGADYFLQGLSRAGTVVIDLERLLDGDRLVVSEEYPSLDSA